MTVRLQSGYYLKIFLIAIGSFLFALGLMLTDELFLSMSLSFGNSILKTQYDYPFLGYVGVWQAWEIDFSVLTVAFLMMLLASLLHPTTQGAVVESDKATEIPGMRRKRTLVLAAVVVVAIVVTGTLVYVYSDVNVTSVEVYIATRTVSQSGSLLNSTVFLAGSDTNDRLLPQGAGFSYVWIQQPIPVSGCSNYILTISSANIRTPGFSILYMSPVLPSPIDNTRSNSLDFQIQTPSHSYSGVLAIYLNETATCQ
jgi:hypothetical protein